MNEDRAAAPVAPPEPQLPSFVEREEHLRQRADRLWNEDEDVAVCLAEVDRLRALLPLTPAEVHAAHHAFGVEHDCATGLAATPAPVAPVKEGLGLRAWLDEATVLVEPSPEYDDWLRRGPAVVRAALRAIESQTPERLPDIAWCDCDSAPVYGIEADRHLPSCRYGIVMDFLDIRDPRASLASDTPT